MTPLASILVKTITSRSPVKHKITRFEMFIGPEIVLVVLYPTRRIRTCGVGEPVLGILADTLDVRLRSGVHPRGMPWLKPDDYLHHTGYTSDLTSDERREDCHKVSDIGFHPPFLRNSAFWLNSSFCTCLASSSLGERLPLTARAAAQPDAWPMAIAGAIDRAD
jgi:hypothetical protein